MIGIYKITSPKGRVYIGQSINIEKRIHGYKSMNGSKTQVVLHRSLLKYGVINHKFEVIEECNIELLNTKERYWQDRFDCLSVKGLNSRLTTTDDKSGVMSAETKAKLSKINKGKKLSKEHKAKLSESKKGSKHPCWGKFGKDSTTFGRKSTPEETVKRSEGRKGMKFSESHKKNLSISHTGEKNYRGKIVLCTSTGIFYSTAKEASYVAGINYATLKDYLSGRRGIINKTNYVYV